MENQTKKNLLANGLIVATATVIACGTIGVFGGFLYGNDFLKGMLAVSLVLGVILYVTTIYIMKKADGPVVLNKVIASICQIIILLSLFVIFILIVAFGTLGFINLFS